MSGGYPTPPADLACLSWFAEFVAFLWLARQAQRLVRELMGRAGSRER
jgi:hypothetical protein